MLVCRSHERNRRDKYIAGRRFRIALVWRKAQEVSDHHVVSDNPPARGLLINVKRQARDGLGDNADGLPKWRIAER